MKFSVLLGAATLQLPLAATVMAAAPEPAPLPAAQAQADLALIPASDPSTSGAPQILAAVKGKHPRLLFSSQEMAALKGKISSDPNLQKAYDGTLQWAKIAPIPANPRPPIVADDTSALVKSLAQAPAMAYAYALNHDEATKQKIVATLTAMLKEPFWADGRELDSNMGAACNQFMVGLLFDTVHDELDPALRKDLAANILMHARRQYYLGHKGLLKYPGAGYWTADPQPNHRWYRDMGLAACVLSVADEPGIDASFLLKGLKDEMDLVMKWYPSDGDCHEGAGYQNFGFLPIATATLMMDRVLGTTYQKTSGIKNAATQQLYFWVPGRNSNISWGDDQNAVGGGVGNNDTAFFICPRLSGDKNMQAALLHRVARAEKNDKGGKPPIYPWSMLAFYDPSLSGGDYKTFALSRLFPDIGAASMRDSWDDDAVVFTFKCGPSGGYKLNEFRETTPQDGKRHYVNIAHDDPDANKFALAVNTGFAFHPGVYSFQHKMTKQENTVTIDDKGQVIEGDAYSQPAGDLDMRTLSYLTGWKLGEKGRVVIEGEAANAYRGVTAPEAKGKAMPAPILTRFRRTAIWMPGEYILLLDNIAAPTSHKITWRGNAPKAQVTPDGKGTATTETGDAVGVQFVSDQPITSAVDAGMVLDGRWGNVPVQQMQFTANAPAAKFACVLDPWKKSPTVKMTSTGGTVTVTVQAGASTDTWSWQDPKDGTTPSSIQGTRAGAPLVALTANDKAPKE